MYPTEITFVARRLLVDDALAIAALQAAQQRCASGAGEAQSEGAWTDSASVRSMGATIQTAPDRRLGLGGLSGP